MGDEQSTSGPDTASDAAVSEFFDALTAYAIDPTTWTGLMAQLDRLSEHLESWDPGALVAELSRAESLSWRIKDSVVPGRSGFAYLLLNDRSRVVGGSSNLTQLAEYLTVGKKGRLSLTDPASEASLDDARRRLGASQRGHSLIALAHPESPRQRYGFLIARAEFPPTLAQIATDEVTHALFVAQDDGGQRLEQVVQASFGLTAAEADVTMRLAQGLTLKEAAKELDISVNTARNHLQSVFDKSGINRQSDLVLVVTQLSVILAGTETETARTNRTGPRSPARHFMILKDGRRLAYRTYGDVHGAPVVYLHESLGCSSLLPTTDELARELGLHLIAPERPGFGFSDVHPGFTFDSVTADLVAFLDHLHIERCALLGFLSGGAYAMDLAARHPQRVTHLMLVAGRPPRPMTGRFEHFMPLYTKMVAHPWLLTSFFNILRNRASAKTNAQLINGVYGAVAHDRLLLQARPEIFEHMIAYTLESMSVTAGGVAGELNCFASSKAADIGRLQMPVTAWHGMADKLADIDELEAHLTGQLVRWRRFPKAGSLILYEHWEEVLQTLAGAET